MTVALCNPRQRQTQILNGLITLETTNNNQQPESNN